MMEEDTDTGIDRRTYLAALSTTAGAAIAGCSEGDGSDGSSGGDLGERVSEVYVEAMSGLPSANEMEQVADHVRTVLAEDLGVPADVRIKEFLTLQEEVTNDNRERNFHIDYHPPFPFFLDPNRLLTGYDLPSAGANGQGNVAQYANCEHTMRVEEQSRTVDQQERREMIHEALSIASEDVMFINLLGQTFRGAYRTDLIEVPEVGEGGITDFNVEMMWESRPLQGEDKVMNISPANIDGVAYQASSYVELWSHCVYSSLVYFDKRFELQPGLAKEWDASDDGTRITFSLREGATFHDGEPLTAEDVRWTYEWINDNSGELALAEEWPYESIEAVDDHTVEFNFEEPVGPFLRAHAPMWGILPSEIWIEAGAEENPADPDIEPDEIVGSGPYQVRNFQREEILDLEPYEDHWIDVEGNLIFRGFQDSDSARRAFMQGEINFIHDISGAAAGIIEDELGDDALVDQRPSFMDWWVIPQTNFGPTKFRSFRLALSQALDRTLLNELLEFGESEPHLYSCFFGPTHPFYPDDPDETLTQIADSEAPNVERAREILEDDGWGWDDDENLHYPANADLEPLWPEGTEPMDHPDLFPCVEDLQ